MLAAKLRCLGMIFIAGLSALGCGAPACAQEDHVVMTLPANVMQFLGIYPARDLNFWKREGLDVKTILVPGVGSFNAVTSSPTPSCNERATHERGDGDRVGRRGKIDLDRLSM